MTLITSPEQIPVRTTTDSLLHVPVPEWGDGAYILIGRMNGIEYQDYINYVRKESLYGVPKSEAAAIIAACWRNENGKPVMSPSKSEPLATNNDFAVLQRIAHVCLKHNCLDGDAYEDLKKNYAAITSNDSATDLPDTSTNP